MKKQTKDRLRLCLAIPVTLSFQFLSGYWLGSGLRETITMSVFFYAIWLICFVGLLGLIIQHIQKEG